MKRQRRKAKRAGKGCVVLALCSIFAGAPGPARAVSPDASPTDENEVLLLRKELEILKHQMLSVEAHLKKLENKAGGSARIDARASAESAGSALAAKPSATPVHEVNAPSTKELWASISDGMSQDEISALLGPPQRTYVLNGKTVWYYAYSGIGPGSIVFNSDRRASSHQTPGFWPW